MPKEIERKFLVLPEALPRILQGVQGVRIRQGYLPSAPDTTYRVRIKGTKAYITLKLGREGISCDEYEYEIPMDHALDLLGRHTEARLEKTRYEVPYGGHRWEVDLFDGKLAGLALAELELEDINQAFPRPPWAGEEVSERPEYSNSALARAGACP